MVQSILYATDLGLYSPYVLQHALSLARSFGAQCMWCMRWSL